MREVRTWPGRESDGAAGAPLAAGGTLPSIFAGPTRRPSGLQAAHYEIDAVAAEEDWVLPAAPPSRPLQMEEPARPPA